MALSKLKKRLIENQDVLNYILILGMSDAQLQNIIDNAKANFSELTPVYKRRINQYREREQNDVEPNLGRFEHEQEANPTIPGE